MALLVGIIAAIITSLVAGLALETVIETFIGQDHSYWIYVIMAGLAHYFVALFKAE